MTSYIQPFIQHKPALSCSHCSYQTRACPRQEWTASGRHFLSLPSTYLMESSDFAEKRTRPGSHVPPKRSQNDILVGRGGARHNGSFGPASQHKEDRQDCPYVEGLLEIVPGQHRLLSKNKSQAQKDGDKAKRTWT